MAGPGDGSPGTQFLLALGLKDLEVLATGRLSAPLLGKAFLLDFGFGLERIPLYGLVHLHDYRHLLRQNLLPLQIRQRIDLEVNNRHGVQFRTLFAIQFRHFAHRVDLTSTPPGLAREDVAEEIRNWVVLEVLVVPRPESQLEVLWVNLVLEPCWDVAEHLATED